MYIGIIGYKGEDKNKIAQLYGQTFDWLLTHDRPEGPDFEYIKEYTGWCDRLADGEDLINDNVYYASFSHPLKMIVSMITGVPFNVINDRKLKNEYIINIKSLQYKFPDGSEKLMSPEKLFKKRNRNLSLEYDDKQELPDAWMTLNDYIIYFGYYLCRNYIGKDIWTNVERVSNNKLPLSGTIRIYTDIRSVSEYNYIKEKGGIVIRLNQAKESDCVVYDKELFSVDADIEMGWFNNVRGLYDEIYKNCYEILQDAEL